MQQLPLSVTLRDDATFGNFQPLAGNALALQALQGLSVAGDFSVIYLAGHRASGRSHLLQAVCHEHPDAIYLPLAELVDYQPDEVLSALEYQSLLCLDDIDALAGNRQWEEALFHLMNRKAQAGGVLLVSASQVAAKLFELPDLVSRLQQGLALTLSPPDDEDKASIFIARGDRRGLVIAPEVATFVLRHYSRDLLRLMELLQLLDNQSLSLQRRITIPFVRKVIAAEPHRNQPAPARH
jgi:DnaA family protein